MIDDVTLARALHVLCVVHWIGGVGFVTLIALPIAAGMADGEQALAFFASVERRFAAQVRISIPLAGATGLWMTWRLDLWDRFGLPEYWWMTSMLGLWLVFMAVVFVAEPLLHGWFERWSRRHPALAIRRMRRLHAVLLLIAVLTVLGAAAGSHGLLL